MPTPVKGGLSCPRCGARYSLAAWSRLGIALVLAPEAAGAHVVGWDPACSVVVRTCASCGSGIARKSRQAAIDSPP